MDPSSQILFVDYQKLLEIPIVKKYENSQKQKKSSKKEEPSPPIDNNKKNSTSPIVQRSGYWVCTNCRGTDKERLRELVHNGNCIYRGVPYTHSAIQHVLHDKNISPKNEEEYKIVENIKKLIENKFTKAKGEFKK